jgi:hypothetical protein
VVALQAELDRLRDQHVTMAERGENDRADHALERWLTQQIGYELERLATKLGVEVDAKRSKKSLAKLAASNQDANRARQKARAARVQVISELDRAISAERPSRQSKKVRAVHIQKRARALAGKEQDPGCARVLWDVGNLAAETIRGALSRRGGTAPGDE